MRIDSIKNLEILCKIFISLEKGDYDSVQEELHSPFGNSALVVMAELDFKRTLPYLKERLRQIPDLSYEWRGHPIYYDPFILTLGMILEDRIDQNLLQVSIDQFKPLSDLEKRFFDYTLRCLFYIEPEKGQKIKL